MIRIGPHVFTETDAVRTLANIDELWQQLGSGRDASSIEPLRPQLTGELATDLVAAWGALLAAGPALRAAGQLPARAVGVVAQLSTSRGGVPKLPTPRVQVDHGGVVGDRQATRIHHGRPWQALCLWSTEVIASLRDDGHPIDLGNAGENVTVAGLAWDQVRAGVRLQAGSVLCEVSAFALPCSKNARWFLGGDIDVMHHGRGPVSRVYATVLEPGSIGVGDEVVLEP